VYNITLSDRKMAKAYTKEFLVAVYISRYAKCEHITIETLLKLEENANKLYDEKGRTEFRKYASVTPEAIQEYLNA
jgi:hypothetical protein